MAKAKAKAAPKEKAAPKAAKPDIGTAVKDVLARSGAKRLPDAVDYNKDALGASEDGKFKSRGEFFQKVYEAGNGLGIDPRLMHTRNLGESFGDAGGFLVPEEFRPAQNGLVSYCQ